MNSTPRQIVHICIYACSFALFSIPAARGVPVTFDFNDGTEFDGGASAGATMTRDGGNPIGAITLTSVEVKAPNIVDGTWDGVTYVDAVTTIVSTPNTLGVNNPTVGGNSELQSFNPQESWTVEFNKPVVVNNIGFQAFNNADIVNMYVGESFFSFNAPASDIPDPFAGLMIPAGTDIRFEAPGDPLDENGSVWRIAEITVTELPIATLTIDRLTGEMTLTNTASPNLSLIGYEIDSTIGGLNLAGWTPISGNSDAPSNGGDGSVDNDDVWTVLTDQLQPYPGDLSEFAFGGPGQGNDGAQLALGESISLGQGWFPTPFEEDVTMVMVDETGGQSRVGVVYTGNGGNPLTVGDLNHDGSVGVDDWLILNSFRPSDLSELPAAQAYLRGDLDGDGDNDGQDFIRFVAAFELENGVGSFAQAISSVPEPTSALLLVTAAVAGFLVRKKQRLLSVVALLVLGAVSASPASADLLAWYRMGDDDFSLTTPPVDGARWDDAEGSLNNPLGTWDDSLDTTSERAPYYSNMVPGAFIYDPTSANFYSNNWSMETRAGSENNGDTSSMEFSEQFTYETFFRYDDLVGSEGMPIGHHLGNIGGGWSLLLGSSGEVEVTLDGYNESGSGVELASATTLTPGQWYHVALVFDGNSSDGSNDTHLYIDHQHEVSGNFADHQDFGNPNGTVRFYSGSLRGDAAGRDGRLDEVRYLDAVLTPNQFLQTVENDARLTIEVDPDTGNVSLRNLTTVAISLNDYQINSPDGRLLNTWEGLGNLDAIGGGNDPGESWTKGGTSDLHAISESFLLGSSTISPGQAISIGEAYLPGAEDSALTFIYSDVTLGGAVTGVVDYLTTSGLLGDYNDDGSVDAADYTVWRNNLGAADGVLPNDGTLTGDIGPDHYQLWKTHFGESSAPALVASTVPEPRAALLLAMFAAAVVAARHRTRFAPARIGAVLATLFAACGSASADYTIDRFYSLGDYDDGSAYEGTNPAAGPAGTPATTNYGPKASDAILGIDGMYAELLEIPAVNLPVYYEITSTDLANGHLGDAGTFALEFSGDDALYSDRTLNKDGLSADTPLAQGVQMLVKPSSAGLAAQTWQSILSDTNNFGGPAISSQGYWTMTSSGHDDEGSVPGTVEVVPDVWSHVAMHAYLPGDPGNPGGGDDWTSVLYVNGVAVAANADVTLVPTTETPGQFDLQGDYVLGAKDDDATVDGFFTGVIDEVTGYVVTGGQSFNLLEDNEYITHYIANQIGSSFENYETGDINLDGDVDSGDIDAFVANWKREKTLSGAHDDALFVGDLETLQWGDITLDGRVTMSDAILLHQALVANGSALDFSLLSGTAVPEPTSIGLLGGLVVALACGRQLLRGKAG